MATTGNGIEFGDLVNRGYNLVSGTSSTRSCFVGYNDYQPDPARTTKNNVIQTVQIATTGNAVDFGDLAYITSDDTQSPQGGSNAHGGL